LKRNRGVANSFSYMVCEIVSTAALPFLAIGLKVWQPQEVCGCQTVCF
jgi:hypothetical protein